MHISKIDAKTNGDSAIEMLLETEMQHVHVPLHCVLRLNGSPLVAIQDDSPPLPLLLDFFRVIREQGNELFRKADFQAAQELYYSGIIAHALQNHLSNDAGRKREWISSSEPATEADLLNLAASRCSEQEHESCAICLDDQAHEDKGHAEKDQIDRDKAQNDKDQNDGVRLLCGHWFHWSCASHRLLTKNCCPLCGRLGAAGHRPVFLDARSLP